MTLDQHKRTQGSFSRRRDDYLYLNRDLPRPACAAEILDIYVRFPRSMTEALKWSEADLEKLLEYGYERREIRAARRRLIDAGLLIHLDTDAKGVMSCRANFELIEQGLRSWAPGWRERLDFLPKARPRGRQVVSIDRDRDIPAANDRDKSVPMGDPDSSDPPIGTNLLRSEAGFGTDLTRPSLLKETAKNTKEELASNRDKSVPVETRPANLQEEIRKTIGVLKLTGEPISEHTLRVLDSRISILTRAVESQAIIALGERCKRYLHDRRTEAIGWGIVVEDTGNWVKESLKKLAELRLAERKPPQTAPVQPPQAFSLEEEIGINEQFLADFPEHPQNPALRRRIAELRRQLETPRTAAHGATAS